MSEIQVPVTLQHNPELVEGTLFVSEELAQLLCRGYVLSAGYVKHADGAMELRAVGTVSPAQVPPLDPAAD